MRAVAVGVIPVVPAVYRLGRKQRAVAQRRAQPARRGEGGLLRAAGEPNDRADGQRAGAEADAGVAASGIQRQGEALRVQLPAAERRGTGLDADADDAPIRALREEIPRHRPLRRESAPLEVAVPAFPMVAKHGQRLGQPPFPTKPHGADRGGGHRQTHVPPILGVKRPKRDLRPRRMPRASFSERSDEPSVVGLDMNAVGAAVDFQHRSNILLIPMSCFSPGSPG